MWVKLSSLLPLSVRGSPAAGGRHGLPDGSLPIRSRSRAASTQRQQAARSPRRLRLGRLLCAGQAPKNLTNNNP